MGKESLFIAQKMFPRKDAIPPEMQLSFLANAGNVDKGMLKQMVLPL